MPPKRSKTARSNTESNQGPLQPEDERKQAASRGKSAKRSATDGEPSRRRKIRVKPQLVATTTHDQKAKKTNQRHNATKEHLPKRNRLITDAAAPRPALAVAKEPTNKTASKIKPRKKKRVQPQFIQAHLNQNSTAVVAMEMMPLLYPFQEQQAPPENPRQRWTELTAVGHILADEIFKYSRDNTSVLSDGEVRQLRSWSESVQNRIYHKSTLVLENTVLAADLKKGQKAVESMRDEMTVLRARTKRFRDEADQLEGNVEKTMKKTSALQGATRFLESLQSLATQAME